MNYSESRIWTEACESRPNDPHEKPRERLRAAYSQFWENACELANQIGKDLPNLTLHDERHFGALWQRADQILGSGEPLTPAEAFVIGGAILLHDAANTITAYPGGIAEIENTPEWKDEITSQLARSPDQAVTEQDRSDASAETRSAALFNVLRQLHAKRAEDLAFMSFKNQQTGLVNHIIPDESLRNHLGRIIGLVAASHHWNIQELPRRLPKIIGALAGFPGDWVVRPVRLACLLRCSDACQLDQTRAPDFLYALLQLKGLSELHWRAQNRLLAPVIDPDDDSALIFTSSAEFGPEDADAWWIAYDAIQVANKELQESSGLLKDLRLKPFQVGRVRDAESPARLSRHVAIRGWRPVSSEVKVSNVSAVVQMFGGEQLYGLDYLVPLRELIQNATDAVRQRRSIVGEENYSGEIVVKLSPCETSEDHMILELLDDGIGMSENVLTGPLIDFGSSYVGSNLAKFERPGLYSQQAPRTGRFGVGFFSVFMIADAVSVTSRPFDRALSDSKTLLFREGFTLRPLLLDSTNALPTPLISTKVSIRLHKDNFEKMTTIPFDYQYSSQVAFKDLIRFVGPAIDCDIYCQEGENDRELVHSRYWHEGDLSDWLNEVLLRKYRSERCEFDRTEALDRLRRVSATDPRAGIAAISTGHVYTGLRTVGGLITTSRTLHHARYEDEFIGVLDSAPRGPKRDVSMYETNPGISAWATDQARILAHRELTLLQAHTAVVRVSSFGGDPTPIIQASVSRVPRKLSELVRSLAEGGTVIVPFSRYNDSSDTACVARLRLAFDSDNPYSMEEVRSFKDRELSFDQDVLECPVDELYWAGDFYEFPVDPGIEVDENSLFGCLARELRAAGYCIVSEDLGVIKVATYVGRSSTRDGLKRGGELRTSAYAISAKRAS